mgnify:CR=1 FL=1
MPKVEHHRSTEGGWLRAAVLGGNDGIVSTSALVVGIAAANPGTTAILIGGIAGLVAGALSMGVGEYVSVSSERDAQLADLDLERKALKEDPEAELQELTDMYVERGVEPDLARQVAAQLMRHDALGAHMREELGLDPEDLTSPVQAAVASTVSFAAGALPAVIVAALVPAELVVVVVGVATFVLLVVLGALSSYQAGAPMKRGVPRVVIGGLLAMGISAGIGWLLGLAV